jgi:alkylation response protein AidB-like acyl-CoA dehydrogenase
MDTGLSDDQEFFRETTSKFLEAESPLTRVRGLIGDPTGFDRDTWTRGAELGWYSMLVPEEYGGGNVSGAGVADLAIIVEEMGRLLYPGPVVPTNLVALAITEFGTPEQQQEHLGSIVAGETIATWALVEEHDRWEPGPVAVRAVPDGDGFVLHGTKAPIQDAHVADLFLVTARSEGGFTHFLVPASAEGLTITPMESLDLTRRFAQVRFDNVAVPASSIVGVVDEAIDDIERLLELALALQCAESVGVADCTFQFTLAYAQDRKAFGRAIGGFQAIKHRFADMLGWLESAKAVSVAAVQSVQRDVDASEMTSVAKAYVGTHLPQLARDCLQIHGGIGYTWEHDLHLYLRRLESNRALYGSPEQHLDRLAAIIGLSTTGSER